MPPPLEIRPASPDDREAWDAFQRRHGGTVYQEWAWGEIAAAATGDRWHRAVAREGDEIVGTTCCLERRRMGLRMGLSPLLTPYVGPTISHEAENSVREIREALFQTMRRRFRLLHLQINDDIEEYTILPQCRTHPRRTLLIDLDRPEPELWSALKSSAKRQIKKARENSDIRVFDSAVAGDADSPDEAGRAGSASESCAPTWEEVDRLTRSTFEKRGEKCPIASGLIRGLLESPELAERRRILTARDGEGSLLSVVVSLVDRPEGSSRVRTAYYTHAATDPDALKSGVSSLLVWETLARLAKGDAANPPAVQFDFCGGNIPGIAKFKEGFAPREHLYPEIQTARPMRLLTLRDRWRKSK